MDLMFKHFMPEETLHMAAKVTHREEAFDDCKKCRLMFIKEMNYELDVCCLDEDSEDLKIIAGAITILEKKADPPIDWKLLQKMMQTEETKNYFEMVEFLHDAYNVSDAFNLDLYYNDRGIVVLPDYRGIGIAGEMLKARMVKSKERGVPMIGAWMTAFGTQKAAANLGWETICEVNCKDLGKMAGIKFEEGPPSCKLMIIKV